jgi:hypothetical protein
MATAASRIECTGGAPLAACRDCKYEISRTAVACPHCGAPYPAKVSWNGWGFEYKSDLTLLGLPLVHISFKYRANRTPVVANGWLAIGQFSCGIVNISQFGVGPVALSQFALAGAAISQICAAGYALCQIGLVNEGVGQIIVRISDLLG